MYDNCYDSIGNFGVNLQTLNTIIILNYQFQPNIVIRTYYNLTRSVKNEYFLRDK